ncbi:MAG: FdtA/QdtA family cupin domain-containing protein [Thermoanaerobaculia bacterium]
MTTVNDCRTVELPKVYRPEGSLTAVQGGVEVRFPIERIYYLYDVPGGETRGGHAHLQLQQVIISAFGSFDVVLDDAITRRTVTLNRAHHGLYVPTMIWRELVNFSSGGICLVLASEVYREEDYIRDYDQFIDLKRGARSVS